MNRPAVLLVDDEPEILNSLGRNIRSWCSEQGLEIVSAESAAEAERRVEADDLEVHIVISDQRMPGMKGDEFLRRFKSLQPDAVALVLTGYTEMKDIEKLLNSDIFAYLLKPWDRERLIIELRKAEKYYQTRKQERIVREKIEKELELGAEFQKALQRNVSIPKDKRVDFHVSSIAASHLDFSGDYYDIIKIGEKRFLILVGDVAGHGLNTAFIGGILKSIIYPEFIKPFTGGDFSTSRFLRELNRRIVEIMHNLPDVLIAFSAALLDIGTGSLLYSNAGLPPAVLVRLDDVATLEAPQMPLGASDSLEFSEHKVNFEAPDVLLMYTDGLHPTGYPGVSFVEKDLLDAFHRSFSRNALDKGNYGSTYKCSDVDHERVFSRVKNLIGTESFDDDVTLLSCCLRW
ncbi:MAG: SpoIIE family protein phosphatase [Spirochaetales bacterium]|nr:SpoIIE family protein phosphatase [Spirochaetales bacterium]MCF7938289.1 SpoIIE family protein phosphatase [Spirochaetales bacterium]